MASPWRRWTWAWGPAAGYMAVIFILSSFPIGVRLSLGPITFIDKLIHAVEYGILCLLLFRGLRSGRNRRAYLWAPLAALLLSGLYGATDEWHQSFTGRDAAVADWLADTVGATAMAAALTIYAAVHKEPAS